MSVEYLISWRPLRGLNSRPSVYKTTLQWRHASVPKLLAAPAHAAKALEGSPVQGIRDSWVRSLSPPPPTLRSCVVSEALAIAPRSQRHVCQILWLARSLLLQSSRMSPFRRPVSAAKNSVPDSSIGDWFR